VRDTLVKQKDLLKKTSDKLPFFNSGQSGFYRVNYDKTTLQKIIKQLDTISMVDKIGLLADLAELSKSSMCSSTVFLDVLPHFAAYNRSTIWDVISGWIGTMRLVMDDKRVRDGLKPFIWRLIEAQYGRLGWDKRQSDNIDDQLLRPIILSMGVSAEHPEITARALQEFSTITEPSEVDPSLRDSIDNVDIRRSIEVDPDIRGVVFGAAARHGDRKTFDKLLSMHNRSSSSEERDALCAALTNFKQPEIIKDSLSLITSKHVRLQDVTYWLVYSLMNRHAREATWQWLQDNWHWMEKHFEGDLGFCRIPIYTARCFSSNTFKKDYESFFEPLRTPALSKSIDQGLETISWHIEWKRRDLQHIIAALNS
jgi:aminopeptidase 2